MSSIIRLSKKNHLALDNHFKNAPKSYEEALKMGHTPPIPFGKKRRDFENEHEIILSLLDTHSNEDCSCKSGEICLLKKYENKEITIDEIFYLMK